METKQIGLIAVFLVRVGEQWFRDLLGTQDSNLASE